MSTHAITATGWLLCDGSSFSGTTYPDLNTFLGGTTLPDMRGYVRSAPVLALRQHSGWLRVRRRAR